MEELNDAAKKAKEMLNQADDAFRAERRARGPAIYFFAGAVVVIILLVAYKLLF